MLFLFVVMMLDVDLAQMRQGFMKRLPLGLGFAGLLLAQIIFVILAAAEGDNMVTPARNFTPDISEATNTHAIGQILYTDYIFPFQMAGLVLLVSMIGAIVLTLRTRPGVRKQKIAKQVARRREDALELVDVKTGEGI